MYRCVFPHEMACFLGTLLSEQESPCHLWVVETCRGSVAPAEWVVESPSVCTHVLSRAKRAEENSTQHRPAKETRLPETAPPDPRPAVGGGRKGHREHEHGRYRGWIISEWPSEALAVFFISESD